MPLRRRSRWERDAQFYSSNQSLEFVSNEAVGDAFSSTLSLNQDQANSFSSNSNESSIENEPEVYNYSPNQSQTSKPKKVFSHVINIQRKPGPRKIYPFLEKDAPEDPSTSPRYRGILNRWGIYDESVLVIRADPNTDKKANKKRIRNAMLKNYTFIVLEDEHIASTYYFQITCGNWLHYVCLGSSYITAFMAYLWPHLKWTWMPTFVLASIAAFGYNVIWMQYPAFNYTILKPNDPIIRRMPMERLDSGNATVLQLNNTFRNRHQRAIFGWCLYTFLYYRRIPPPPCTNDWKCVHGVPYYATKYGLIDPSPEDTPKLNRNAY